MTGVVGGFGGLGGLEVLEVLEVLEGWGVVGGGETGRRRWRGEKGQEERGK